ncbi:hypothetical protein [Mucilaginibacter sp. HD30]
MTVAAIKEKLYHYISEADDKKIKALYTLLEEQMNPVTDWSEDVEFVAELDERYRRWEAGIDRGYNLEEVKEYLNQQRKDRQAGVSK